MPHQIYVRNLLLYLLVTMFLVQIAIVTTPNGGSDRCLNLSGNELEACRDF
jgi:hypothetical protein